MIRPKEATMNRYVTRLLLGMAGSLLLLPGCHYACHQPCPPVPPAVVGNPIPSPVPLTPSVLPPQAPPSTLPPALPPAGATRGYAPPLANPADSSSRPPPTRPAHPLPPHATSFSLSRPHRGPRLQAPELPPPPPRASVPEERAPTPALPVGIPQFALAQDQIATGLKPMLDGVEWLQQNGYRPVLHLRQPGEDDTAER